MNSNWQPKAYADYKWIVCDPELLNGKPAIRGTRMAVSLILGCLSEKMTVEEIEKTYGIFPKESLPEIFRFAAEAVDRPHAAA